MPQDEVTKLSPADELMFKKWVESNKTAPGVGNWDKAPYDMKGFFADKPALSQWKPGDHFPDTYKQHGHPTFSVESKYSTGPNDGGTWQGEKFIPPLFSTLLSRAQSIGPNKITLPKDAQTLGAPLIPPYLAEGGNLGKALFEGAPLRGAAMGLRDAAKPVMAQIINKLLTSLKLNQEVTAEPIDKNVHLPTPSNGNVDPRIFSPDLYDVVKKLR